MSYGIPFSLKTAATMVIRLICQRGFVLFIVEVGRHQVERYQPVRCEHVYPFTLHWLYRCN